MNIAVKLGKIALLAAAAIAVVAMAGISQSRAVTYPPGLPVDDPISDSYEEACPSNNVGPCSLSGISAPNNLLICPSLPGVSVHATAGQFGTTLPITQTELNNNNALWFVGNGNAGTAQTFAEAIAPDGWLCNTKSITPANWVYGPSNDVTTAQMSAPFYNKVTAAMFNGLAVTGTRWADAYESDYCSTALYQQSTNDFNWVDMMHGQVDESGYGTAWDTTNYGPIPYTTSGQPLGFWPNVNVGTTNSQSNCGYSSTFTYTATTPPVPSTTLDGGNIRVDPGHFGSSIDERESQHYADVGGDVAIRPVTNTRDAQESVFWVLWPPFGHRSQGFATSPFTAEASLLGAAGYRSSYNDNIVVMVLVQSPLQHAADINGVAAVNGVDAIIVDQEDLARQMQSTANATAYANKLKAAAAANGKYYCTLNWTATPVSTNPSFSTAKINCPAISYPFYRTGQPYRL